MTTFGNYLKELRGEKSLREMERITGISHTYLSTLEKGYDPRSGKERKPTPEIIRQLSDSFDLDYFKLMVLAGYMNEEEANSRKAIIADSKSSIDKTNKLLVNMEKQDYIERLHVKLENIFDFSEHLYLDEASLTQEERQQALDLLRALFRNKEKDYPSEEVLEKEYEKFKIRQANLLDD
ncbi:helix-turn-helix domain-containing protein [Lysinibacillus sp. ZYM-1]|uniref:helix-turn-helix domain-containing protein n=1 Tax=Lysinibacillus sp. ZYM-1 TaxID=1681184 RepID=UPI0006CEA537|nr:helix-turn-helix transcriptional regulator [Lysinibacillus sp. ZYM-1]KPN97740.1 hypothetical protein AO843_11260 [Lysinibacillus sp. ZYM-1]